MGGAVTPLEKLALCGRVLKHGTYANRYAMYRHVVGYNPIRAALRAGFERLMHGV
jgi:hypothetical protein